MRLYMLGSTLYHVSWGAPGVYAVKRTIGAFVRSWSSHDMDTPLTVYEGNLMLTSAFHHKGLVMRIFDQFLWLA